MASCIWLPITVIHWETRGKERAGQPAWTEDSDAFFTIWFPPGRRVCLPEKDLTVSLALWQEVWITTGGDAMTVIVFRIETNLVLLFLAHISPICPSATSPAMARVLVGTTSTMVRAWPGARKGSTRPRSSHRELARSWRVTTPRKGRSSCCSHFRSALLQPAGSSSHRSHLDRSHPVGIWPDQSAFFEEKGAKVFLLFHAVFYVLFPRLACEIKPMGLKNIPSGNIRLPCTYQQFDFRKMSRTAPT